ILEGQQNFLLRIHSASGSSGVLLVIKVRMEGVNANDVLENPLVKLFEHVVVASVHPLANERLSNLIELAKLVEFTVHDAYADLAAQMSLDVNAWAIARPIIRLFLNPIDILEAANALVEIQLEPQVPSDLRYALLRRALPRLLSSRNPDQLVALAAYA